MPEVLVEAIVKKVKMRLLLNTGARDLELVLPLKLASRAGIEATGRTAIFFGGRKLYAKTGRAEVTVMNPKSDEKRTSRLEVVVLPDKVLDLPLLGVLGQEKLRIAPDTVVGEVLFR